MILTTVTDEVLAGEKLESIFATAIKEGIYNFEIRSIEGKRFPLINDDMMNQLIELRKRFNITYSAVSPGIFKVPLNSDEFELHKGLLLDRTFKEAEKLGISKIIIFGIKRNKNDRKFDYEKVIEEIGDLTTKAKVKGFTILIENEPGYWSDSSDNCLKILKDINMKSLRLNWDPGNLFNTGEKHYKVGYEKLKKFIDNVHVKGAAERNGRVQWTAIGEGDIDYIGQIADLKKDGYKGNITVETHCCPLFENFKKSTDYIKKLL